MINLSNDMTEIKRGKSILLKISREFDKNDFFWPAISHLIICFSQ